MTQQNTISQAHLATGRAVDQLRRQLGIVFVQSDGTPLGGCPVEGLTPSLLKQLQALPHAQLQLLVTTTRARTIGFDLPDNTQLVSLHANDLSLAELQAIADPVINNVTIPELHLLPVNHSHEMLLSMAKYASLLPAMLVIGADCFPENWLSVSAADLAAYWEAPPLDMVPLVEAALPIEGAENAKLVCFRMRYGTSTHLALIIGDITQSKDGVLTRVHSSCITGDILGSLRCDCGDQLGLAIDQIQKEGQGILLYLHQEGRGIGIANKLRAYALQERGVDTYDANLMLGFDADERDFSIAAAMLNALDIPSIRLLTNNPEKIKALEKYGIKINKRVPVVIKSGKHNHAYLDAKAKKSGHLF